MVWFFLSVKLTCPGLRLLLDIVSSVVLVVAQPVSKRTAPSKMDIVLIGFLLPRYTRYICALNKQSKPSKNLYTRPPRQSIAGPSDESYPFSMKLRLVLEHDPKTQRWAAFFPELPGCASAGDTEAEAIENAKEALELWFEPSAVSVPAGAKVLEIALP